MNNSTDHLTRFEKNQNNISDKLKQLCHTFDQIKTQFACLKKNKNTNENMSIFDGGDNLPPFYDEVTVKLKIIYEELNILLEKIDTLYNIKKN